MLSFIHGTCPRGARESAELRGNADMGRLRSSFQTLGALARLQTIFAILALDLRQVFIRPRTLTELGYQESTQGCWGEHFCSHCGEIPRQNALKISESSVVPWNHLPVGN